MTDDRTPRDRQYVFGYPRAVVRIVAGECLTWTILVAMFVVGPGYLGWMLCTGPWYLATSWHVVGLPLAVAFAAIVCVAVVALIGDLRGLFGVRVVPQFSGVLEPSPDTYLSGRTIAAHMRRLDALADAAGVAPLSRRGFARSDDAGGPWFDAASGRATVEALLARVEPSTPLHAELARWSDVLQRAGAAGLEFRLVLVSGTAMNGPLWAALRAQGF